MKMPRRLGGGLVAPVVRRRVVAGAVAVFGLVFGLAWAAGPAVAQGNLLDVLFGRLVLPLPRFDPAPATPAFTDPTLGPAWHGPPPGALPYCVRLCDGKYFPLPRTDIGSAAPARLCRALCPHAATRIYWGTGIDNAVTLNQMPYSALDNAFRYRTELAADCTCNGKDPVGTAAISVYADATLQPGDIVATEDGFRIFVGTRGTSHRPSEFVTATNYSRLPRETRARLQALDAAAAYSMAAPASQAKTAIAVAPASVDVVPPASLNQLAIRSRIIIGFEALEQQNPQSQPGGPLRITVTRP